MAYLSSLDSSWYWASSTDTGILSSQNWKKKKIVENGVEGQDSFAIDCILETALAF